MAINFIVNDAEVSVDIDPQTPLLEALRNDLELNGPRFGCGLAQCGACAVLVDGVSIRSCVTPISAVAGKQVTTIEGLGSKDNPHPLQAAFVEEQAMQCGYCASGIMITAAALLEKSTALSEADIRKALSGHLCRCGAHPRMLRAIISAAKEMGGEA